jgi:hypothetical protein
LNVLPLVSDKGNPVSQNRHLFVSLVVVLFQSCHREEEKVAFVAMVKIGLLFDSAFDF